LLSIFSKYQTAKLRLFGGIAKIVFSPVLLATGGEQKHPLLSNRQGAPQALLISALFLFRRRRNGETTPKSGF
jgi:hypothetical protein